MSFAKREGGDPKVADASENAFVDDAALPSLAQQCRDLLSRSRRLIKIEANVFHAHGLKNNWNNGKSELVMKQRGPNAKAVARYVFEESAACHQVDFGGLGAWVCRCREATSIGVRSKRIPFLCAPS